MLNIDKHHLILLLLIFISCDFSNNNYEKSLTTKSYSKIPEAEYNNIYTSISDSIEFWGLNSIGQFNSNNKNFGVKVDSILCFNQKANRLVTCIHTYVHSSDATSDGFIILYGERFHSFWFYFCGPSIVIPRDIVKGHPWNKPLSYQQLHQIALKEVYGGYLKNGEINEEWFDKQFENSGWGLITMQSYSDDCLHGKRYSDEKEFYKAMHLCAVKAQWAGRDTTKPIIPLPEKSLP